VADEKKPKSPEELGEAVGRKIEALFGGLFDDSAEEKQNSQATDKSAEPAGAPPSGPAAPPPTSPPPQSVEAPPAAEPRPAVDPEPAPERAPAEGLDGLLDQIEALILNLEWEAKQETVLELTKKFREADRYFPKGQGKNLIHMNHRVLHRHGSLGASPHPMLLKLLQESVAVLKQLSSAGMATPPDQSAVTSITSTYNQIVSSFQPREEAPAAPRQATDFRTLMSNMGGAVHSLEEVGQRLARIRAVLRKGGDMPEEEIVRRLGTLEAMLSERVSKLLTLHRDLAQVGGPEGAGQEGSALDGLLLVEWYGLPLAIPSSMLGAIYPLAKSQAEQFMRKSTIVIANRQIPRLPLKKPRSAQSVGNRPPSWLIHLSLGKKDFFLLADRATGYRRLPKRADLAREGRIKIGNTTYSVLSPAFFR
jgi:hypothetical protein